MSTTNGEAARCALWARVSTTDQHTDNQLHVLREWAHRRGFEVAREFVTEDSAWRNNGNGSKGKQFDTARKELSQGAHRGEYSRILIWSLDRLSRRGIKDTIGVLEDLDDAGAIVCSHQQEWLETSDRRMRQLIVSVMSWMAEMESDIRSERIKAGLARRRREGLPVGGRQPGAKDKRPRERRTGEAAGWTPERRAQLAQRNRQRAQERGVTR